jgi:hypothetical protein
MLSRQITWKFRVAMERGYTFFMHILEIWTVATVRDGRKFIFRSTLLKRQKKNEILQFYFYFFNMKLIFSMSSYEECKNWERELF